MGARAVILIVTFWVCWTPAVLAETPGPNDYDFRRPDHLDDAHYFGTLSSQFSPSSTLGPVSIGVVQVDQEFVKGNWRLYLARVVLPIKRIEPGERFAFLDIDQTRRHQPWNGLSESAARAFPMMAKGREYLVCIRPSHRPDRAEEWFPSAVPARGQALVHMQSCMTIRSDLRDIRAILPQIQRLADVVAEPWEKQPPLLRELLFANLDTRHEYLRHVVTKEFTSNPRVYMGMSDADAERLATWAQALEPWLRGAILENLAAKTTAKMDRWFLRLVSEGAPGRLRVGDTAGLAGLEDALYSAAPRLSIDSFWPILERKTRPMSIWVAAFAQKRDPRLLPIIVRYLDPENLDPAVAEALAHYRGVPAAEEAVVRAATSEKVKSDKRARALARESLRRVGTPRALATAEQLATDDDESQKNEERRK